MEDLNSNGNGYGNGNGHGNGNSQANGTGPGGHSPTVRDILEIAFRHKRLIALSFFGVLSGAILTAALQPSRYESRMEILVKRDRVDPVVTADATANLAGTAATTNAVTEEELNSEVELLRSKDLLEQIVVTCGLQHPNPHTQLGMLANILQINRARVSHKNSADAAENAVMETGTAPKLAGTPEEDLAIAKAVRKLEKELKVEVLKKTNLIAASYQSPDPAMAARVLATAGSLYLEKHVRVHRPSGAADFFKRETERYRDALTGAETRLVDFDRQSGVVSPLIEKEGALQKLVEFDAALRQTNAAIAETQERIRSLNEEAKSIPSRMVTEVRNADDGMLISQLKTNLLTLEQKRTELLGKFDPSYRPVQEVDAQIAQARAALAEKSQLHEEITNQNPAYEWTEQELAKAKADLAGLRARAQATAMAVRSYQENARLLEQKEIVQQSLIRTSKAAEENYLLYLRKEDEARISDALDRGRFLNVAIAEPASVPSLPSNDPLLTVLLGVLLATLVSVGLTFVSERLDPTFRTPVELGSILNIPVLAAIPQERKNGARVSV